MIYLIDNYDSFSYNLYQLIGEVDPAIEVIRNDALTVEELEEKNPEAVILSPGPGRPADAGICEEVALKLSGKVPILGVCLGHQAICEAFGGTVGYAKELMHGKSSLVKVDEQSPLFKGLPAKVRVARYHSLAADEGSLPECLQVVSRADDGEVMAVQHAEFPTFGVQFHPESILTPDGRAMIENFLAIATKEYTAVAPIVRKEPTMIREAIFKLVDKQDLTYDEAYDVINEIMSGETTQVQTAAFLSALSTKSTKSETIAEIAGCAAAMRSHATKVDYDKPLLEIVGTGGDKAGSFNISTTAAFIIAAGGAKVAKHGNRAASSKSGTADCQEALGVNIEQGPDLCKKLLDEVGMCFFFAQKYHTAMRYVGPIRKELGFRTVFNILGPLTNPASPETMILGVYDESLVQPLARVLTGLGVKDGMVVYGQDCLDELSTACPTTVCEFHGDDYLSYVLTPEELGMKRCTKEDLRGGSPDENAQITRDILSGKETGAKRDTVLVNAAAGLYIAGLAPSLKDGVAKAQELINNGKATETLEEYVRVSNQEV